MTGLVSLEVRCDAVLGTGLAAISELRGGVTLRTILEANCVPVTGDALVGAHRGTAAQTEY